MSFCFRHLSLFFYSSKPMVCFQMARKRFLLTKGWLSLWHQKVHYYNEISTSISAGLFLAAVQMAGLVTLTRCIITTIIFTRSYAALRAADLEWIVGLGYSFCGYILEKNHAKPTWNHEKPWKTNLEPWKSMKNHEKPSWNHEKPWKPMKNQPGTMKNHVKPWKTNLEPWKTKPKTLPTRGHTHNWPGRGAGQE